MAVLGRFRGWRGNVLAAALLHAAAAGAEPPLAPVAVQRLDLPAPGPQSGDEFGASVAVDGNTLVVGSPGHDLAGSDEGAAYVFVRGSPADEWAFAAELVAAVPDPFADDERFGASVAISGDVIVVGAPLYDLFHASSDEGAAFVFVKPAGGWSGTQTESARLQASNPNPFNANEHVGVSVAIEGDLIAVGADSYELVSAASDEGCVFVYERPAGGWSGTRTENARLQASVPNPWGGPEGLGRSVAIEGGVIVAGADLYDFTGPNSDEGAAFVYLEPAGGWSGIRTESAQLRAAVPNPFGHAVRLGHSIAISGSTVLVGADRYDLVKASSDEGVAFVFDQPAGGWSGTLTETAQLRAALPDPFHSDEFFASSVAIEAGRAAVGARSYDGSGPASNEGAAFLYAEPASGWTGTQIESALAEPSDASLGDELGNALDLAGDTLVVGAHLADAAGVVDAGAAYAFTLPGTPANPVPSLDPRGIALTAALIAAVGCSRLRSLA